IECRNIVRPGRRAFAQNEAQAIEVCDTSYPEAADLDVFQIAYTFMNGQNGTYERPEWHRSPPSRPQ
ncbi:MAG: hypothetical protein ACRD9L_08675, partial [Bryobacteraceae bacterium]